MVSEYNQSRKIGSSVGQHTAVKAYVYADTAHSIPVNQAKIAIESLHREEFTNIQGEAEIVQFKPGDYTLSVKANGFANALVPFHVQLGKHIHLTIVLEPKILMVEVQDKQGKTRSDFFVSIVDANISGTTNQTGIVNLSKIPNEGTVEVSNINGDSASMPYNLANLNKLKIIVVVE